MENKFIGYEITPEEKENIGWIADPKTRDKVELLYNPPKNNNNPNIHIKENREDTRALHVIKEGLLLQNLENTQISPSVSKVAEDSEKQKFQESRLIKDSEGNLRWITTLGLEKVEGKNLREQDNISLETSIDIGIDIAKSLKNFRENNIVHGDISPSNVMYDAQTKKTTIIDFEFAEKTNSSIEPMVKGVTLGFASPEKIGGNEAIEEICSEIYATSMTLVSCVANNEVLKSLSTKEAADAFTNADPKMFLEKYINQIKSIQKYINEEAQIPEKLKMILIMNIDPDPTRRFNRWEELITALEMVKDDSVTELELLNFMEKDTKRREQEVSATVQISKIDSVELTPDQSINFNLEKVFAESITPDTELIVIGERHPKYDRKGEDKQNAKDVVEILETLQDLEIKPSFVGIELTTLYEEKLNTEGKIYLESIKPIVEYCDKNGIPIVPIAGNKDLQPGNQDFEDSIASKISGELAFGEGTGLVLLGNMHARKTRLTGNIKVLPATGVLLSKNIKTKVIMHHNVTNGEPGAERIEQTHSVALQNPQYIDLYKLDESFVQDAGEQKPEDCDFILLSPSK